MVETRGSVEAGLAVDQEDNQAPSVDKGQETGNLHGLRQVAQFIDATAEGGHGAQGEADATYGSLVIPGCLQWKIWQCGGSSSGATGVQRAGRMDAGRGWTDHGDRHSQAKTTRHPSNAAAAGITDRAEHRRGMLA